MTIELTVLATADDLVVNDNGAVTSLAAGESYSYTGFSESTDGNDIDDGGLITGSGYYVGWDGESTIAIQRDDATELVTFGTNVNCVIAGFLNLMET